MRSFALPNMVSKCSMLLSASRLEDRGKKKAGRSTCASTVVTGYS